MLFVESIRLKEQIIDEYRNAYQIFKAGHDWLSRTTMLKEILCGLVSRLGQCFQQGLEDEVLSDPTIVEIREEMINQWKLAETMIELDYAKQFIQDRPNIGRLRKFIYWDHYENLLHIELAQFERMMGSWKWPSVVFVGAGSLPLSAILIQQYTRAPVVCLDANPQAYEMGKALAEHYGMQHLLLYRLVDGTSYDYQSCDVVWISSSVPNKEQMVQRIYQTNPCALVVVRSVEGIYQLVDEPVNETAFQHICEEIGRTQATPFIFNSTIFYGFRNA
ncbi:nicotianamine synthase family protein [Geobacillus proteiniphilus]|uniref:Nicotianamine synthase family protein n=1 Tax=Geobacillus proteiniphilus TaxID=860353 RepID=A0A1Q5SKA9_9BACL|nr:nicotianamine synthase family protein [Geobacillus proteiniphilus]OKO88467.1 hypothetical protein BRO54_3639 [Geobacillus proteiniphilus]WMJ17580.1 nicotianamine synthase family protein [Geobacillus proteiniphilus]